jgi:hypothetical protein
VRELSVSDGTLVFRSDHPVAIELPRAVIAHTRIELVGPVTLRFSEDASLAGVDVQTVDPRATIDLTESRALDLRASGATGRFEGTLRFTRSRLDVVKLVTRDFEVRSAHASQLSVKAQSANVIELDGDELTLELQEGVLSYLEVKNLLFQGCGAVLFADSRLYDSTLLPCTQPLRLHATFVGGSAIVGQVEAVGSDFVTVTMGSGADTALEVWEGSVLDARVCPQTRKLALGTDSVACVACEAPVQETPGVLCTAAPENYLSAELNPYCLALESATQCMPAVRNERPF